MFALGSSHVTSLSASISLFFCPFKEYFYVPWTFFRKRESPLSARKTTSCNLFLHRLLTIKDVFRKQSWSMSIRVFFSVFFFPLDCLDCPALLHGSCVRRKGWEKQEKLTYFEMTPLLKLTRSSFFFFFVDLVRRKDPGKCASLLHSPLGSGTALVSSFLFFFSKYKLLIGVRNYISMFFFFLTLPETVFAPVISLDVCTEARVFSGCEGWYGAHRHGTKHNIHLAWSTVGASRVPPTPACENWLLD